MFLKSVNKLSFTILIFPCLSHAYDCNGGLTTTISPKNMMIQRDLPVGSIIGSYDTNLSVNAFSCSKSIILPILTYQEFGVKGYGDFLGVFNGRRIYRTNIAGIGYSITGESVNNCAGKVGSVDGSDNGDGNPNNKILCYKNGFFIKQPIQGRVRVTYYKTESSTGSGTVNGMTVAAFILRNNLSIWQYPESLVNTSSFSITTLACTVNNTAIRVNMGKVERLSFSGVGTWPSDANTKSFSIPLSCNPGTRVNLQIDGSVQNATNGILNLNASTDSATGIGIQLLYNGQPIRIGASFIAGTTTETGNYNIDLKSRYYQISKDITPGIANSSATFTLVYR